MPSHSSTIELAGRLKALADETRLQMLVLLTEHGELCVCDFERALEITQSKASRHLRYLYHARIVDERRQGVWILYRLADDLEPDVMAIVTMIREALDPQVLADLDERLQNWLAIRTCCPDGSCTH
ncbi:MAG: metalloregulator ArsR/SmtB family transcription factor [Thermoleophilia bacterium]|nr:metalloregulator ArsR/SmtB family transcription factor [Thermoleophilia bacterium]